MSFDGPHDLPDGYAAPSELPIHVQTMRTRPEVTSVVHAHPPAVVTADLAGLTLRPVVGSFNIPAMRMAREGIPIYPRAVLIRRAELADEMLAAMGTAPICVLRGHGVTTTGASIQQAVIRALNAEALAKVILGAAQAGGHPPDLSDADVAELPGPRQHPERGERMALPPHQAGSRRPRAPRGLPGGRHPGLAQPPMIDFDEVRRG